MSAKGTLIIKNRDNSKKVMFINHPSVSVETSSTYGYSEITVRGYNDVSEDIILNT